MACWWSGHPRFFNQISSGLDIVGLSAAWLTAAVNTNMYVNEIHWFRPIADRLAYQYLHRCTSHGNGGCTAAPLSRAKTSLFGQKPAAKNERSIYSTLKTEFIASSKMKCPKSKIFVDIYWVGLVGQILHSIFFSGTVEIFFGQRWLSPR